MEMRLGIRRMLGAVVKSVLEGEISDFKLRSFITHFWLYLRILESDIPVFMILT